MAQILCRDLTLGYEGRAIVENLNFSVNRGDYLVVVGENGSGKSTLMKTLLHLIPPMAGEIILGDGLKKNQIGYLPQQTPVQRDFPASVEEIVRSGLVSGSLRPFLSKEEKARAEKNMERMGILPLAKKTYRNLSGGQQQRVLLARALCAADSMLLLDEPTAGLDPKATEGMYALIDTLHREGMTVIMISHDAAALTASTTHVLHVGKKIFFGTREEYLASGKGLFSAK